MPRYSYAARNIEGKLAKGALTADNDLDLANKISNMGYVLTNFRIAQEGGKAARFKAHRLKQKEVLQFTFQLSTLIDSGLPLLEGLRDLVSSTHEERIKKVIEDLRYRIEGGSSLREALALHPRTFSSLYVAIVGAGEATGKLSQALSDLADLLEWQMELRSKIKEASTYPLILFIVMIAVVTLLVVKVIPMFQPMFEGAEMELPLPTRVVLGFSNGVRQYWYLFVFFIIGIPATFGAFYRIEKGRFTIDSIKLKLPVVGDLLRKIALSRFTHTFALSFRAGINLLTCLDISKGTTSNARIEKAIEKARESVNVGEKLANSLQTSGEFPAMVVRMIGVGEQSGALAQTMVKISSYYDKEVASSIKRLFTLFEPLMIVFMGIVVGGIAFAIFLPIFKMSQMVGG